jgi:hypothetical protein
VRKICLTIIAAVLCLSACSQWEPYSDEGTVTRPSNYQDLRKTVVTFDGEKVQYDSLYLFYQDSLSLANGHEIFRFGKIGQRERDALDMYVNIYGCTDMYCSDANKIVFHDVKYEKIRILEKGEIYLSKPESGIRKGESFGENCKLNVFSFFDLKIDLPDVQIDWTLQESEDSCEVTIYY